MPVIDTEQGLRKMADDPARRVRADQGVPLASGGTLTATNVQDAIDQLAANAGGGGGIADAPSDGNIYGRKNAAWAVVPPAAAPVAISDTAPSSPSAGNLWWDSANGQMYVYYNDGTSSQWVALTTAQAVGSGGGGGGGTGSFTTNIVGAATYIVPSGKSTMVGEAWGSGGSGGGYAGSTFGGGGGGGYSKFTTSVSPGQTIYYSVGTAGVGANGPGTAGTNSWVNPSANSQPTSTGCVGGGGGAAGAGGGGGSGTIGTVNYQGGNGASGAGGGGGGAGSGGNATNASGSAHGSGGTPDGGNGGDGVTSGAGASGATPGGGGGGSTSINAAGGSGGLGQVRLTFS